MKLIVDHDKKIVTMVHPDGKTRSSWQVSAYSRTRFKNVEDPFRELNRYLASRSVEIQTNIWNCMLRAQEILSTVRQPKELTEQLQEVITEMYEEHFDIRSLTLWAIMNLKYSRPNDHTMTNPDPDHPREGTYNLRDYHELVLLSIALSLSIPILGEFQGVSSDQAGSVAKESEAFRLLKDCKSIIESPAMSKLSDYVNNYLQDEPAIASATLAGLVREKLPEWLLAKVVVMRVAIGEIDAQADGRGNLVSNIHTSMGSMLLDLDRKFGGKTKARTVGDDSDDEFSRSVADVVAVRQDITVGQQTRYELPIENYLNLAAVLEPEINLEHVELCVITSLSRSHISQSVFHRTICAYIVDEVIRGAIVERLEPWHVGILQGVVQAILWHRGYINLAIQLTATPLQTDDSTAFGPDGKTRMSPAATDQLCKLYTRTQPACSAPADGSHDRRNNIGAKAAREIVKALSSGLFRAEAPDELWALSDQHNNLRRFTIPSDLLEQVAALIITIGEKGQL